VGRNFDRALAAHDAEVILEYVKRAKPEPIHIDNIDGVKASDWFRARDAATREPLLARIAELEEQVARVERKCNTWALGSPVEQMMVVEFREALVTPAEPTEGATS